LREIGRNTQKKGRGTHEGPVSISQKSLFTGAQGACPAADCRAYRAEKPARTRAE